MISIHEADLAAAEAWRRGSLGGLVTMYQAKADSFTEDEKERIKVTTIGVEARTIGEIVTVVIDQSSDYKEADVLGRVFIGGLASLLASSIFFNGSVWAFIPAAFILFSQAL